MKKYFNIAFIYAIAAMVCGVFYREFTKYNGFTQKTVLAVCHTHLFALGTLLFLIIAIITVLSDLESQKLFQRFLIAYNISLPFMTVMFLIRGIIQVLNIQLSNSLNAAIAGIAGISHITMGFSIILLFLSFKHITVKHL